VAPVSSAWSIEGSQAAISWFAWQIRFVRPAPWDWPYPMPYGGAAAGYGAGPDGFGAARGATVAGPGGYDDGEPEPWGEPMGGSGEIPPGGMPPVRWRPAGCRLAARTAAGPGPAAAAGSCVDAG
jgi:hypothetical protein